MKNLVVFAALAALAVGSPTTIFAFDISRTCGSEECVTQSSILQSLQAQLAALQQKINALSGKKEIQKPTSCFVPKYDLYLGRDDSQTEGEVSKLQLWLKETGYFPDAQGTGYYGTKTAEAVVRWQKAHGMDFVTTKSGVGKVTRAKMQATCNSSNSVSTGDKYGLRLRTTYEAGVPVVIAEFHGNFDIGSADSKSPKAYIDFGNGGSYAASKTVCPGDDCYFEVRHLYSKTGSYNVTLHTVNNAKRTDLASAKFTVTETACPDAEAPYIAAITPSSGPKGTEVNILGCNLAGFEGDLIAVFEKDSKAWSIGDLSRIRDFASIRAKVQEPCQKGEMFYPVGDESGIPRACTYTPMTLGTYSVYVNPWNKKSNTVTFTMTQ